MLQFKAGFLIVQTLLLQHAFVSGCDVIITVTVPAVNPPPQKSDVAGTYKQQPTDKMARHFYKNDEVSPALYLFYATLEQSGWGISPSQAGTPPWPVEAHFLTPSTNPDVQNFGGVWQVHDGTGQDTVLDYLNETLSIQCVPVPTEVPTEEPGTLKDCSQTLSITVPGPGIISNFDGTFVPQSYDDSYGRYRYWRSPYYMFYGTYSNKFGWIIHINLDDADVPYAVGYVESNAMNPPSAVWQIHEAGTDGATYKYTTLDLSCVSSPPPYSPPYCCEACAGYSCPPTLLLLDDKDVFQPEASLNVGVWYPNSGEPTIFIPATFSAGDDSQKYVQMPVKVAELIEVPLDKIKNGGKFVCGLSFKGLPDARVEARSESTVDMSDVMFCVVKFEYEDVVFGSLAMQYLGLCIDSGQVSFCG